MVMKRVCTVYPGNDDSSAYREECTNIPSLSTSESRPRNTMIE
jgi:hypothetical protein